MCLYETGWDLGLFAAVLQCLYLDKHLLEQQNTKKLYGTKNNCMHVQLGQILDQRYRRPIKNSTAASEKLGEQKLGVGSKSRVLHMLPARNTT